MSKLILPILCILSFSSCQKKYDCICKSYTPYVSSGANEKDYKERAKNKDQARDKCTEEYKKSGAATGTVSCIVN